jgi:hypothetical protein
MRWIVAIFFVPVIVLAQSPERFFPDPKVASYFQAYRSTSGEQTGSPEKVFEFLNKLSEKRASYKSDRVFLSYVFNKTHQRFLKNYADPSSFNDLLKNGNYNCLTGTALYALILEHLHFNYQVIETNHHIFLLVAAENGQVLFEATDPLTGFESDQDAIEKKISAYRNISPEASVNQNKKLYQFSVSLYNSVNLDEILGLLHYNLSIQAYNKNDLIASVDHLEKAYRYYRSLRLEEFTQIVSLTVLEKPMQPEARSNLLKKLRTIQNNRQSIVASTK